MLFNEVRNFRDVCGHVKFPLEPRFIHETNLSPDLTLTPPLIVSPKVPNHAGVGIRVNGIELPPVVEAQAVVHGRLRVRGPSDYLLTQGKGGKGGENG